MNLEKLQIRGLEGHQAHICHGVICDRAIRERGRARRGHVYKVSSCSQMCMQQERVLHIARLAVFSVVSSRSPLARQAERVPAVALRAYVLQSYTQQILSHDLFLKCFVQQETTSELPCSDSSSENILVVNCVICARINEKLFL